MHADKILSRAYLQGLPEETRQKRINQSVREILQRLIPSVEQAAIAGKTSLLYEPKNYPLNHQSPPIPHDVLVEAFKLKFPDCTVTYFEDWILQELPEALRCLQRAGRVSAEQTKVLKTGILIDWS